MAERGDEELWVALTDGWPPWSSDMTGCSMYWKKGDGGGDWRNRWCRCCGGRRGSGIGGGRFERRSSRSGCSGGHGFTLKRQISMMGGRRERDRLLRERGWWGRVWTAEKEALAWIWTELVRRDRARVRLEGSRGTEGISEEVGCWKAMNRRHREASIGACERRTIGWGGYCFAEFSAIILRGGQ